MSALITWAIWKLKPDGYGRGLGRAFQLLTNNTNNTMRKIELEMVAAVQAQLDGNTKQWRSGNTVVCNVHDADLGQLVIVELHDNVIAEFDVSAANATGFKGLTLRDCGWRTATTKSRLNALLSAFCEGSGIYQSKGQWFSPTGDQWYGTDWFSYRHSAVAQSAREALQKRCESVYDAEWHRAMGESLAVAKQQLAAA